MTSREGTLALAIFGCLLLVLTGCKPSPQPCVGGGQEPHAVPTPVSIVLDHTGTQCGQIGPNGSAPIIDVPRGAGIIWRSNNVVAGNQLVVHFTTGGSPFDSFSSSDGSPVTSGPTNGPVGTTYYYTTLVVDGQSCGNAGQLGIIMR